MSWLEAETSRTFGRGPRPLLVSVRSGATQSMPGMMDTILDLGMNDAVEQALAAAGAAAFARDTRQRFDRMYRRIVGVDEQQSVPADPYAQLRAGIEAVFASWNSPRAVAYRAHYGLDDQGGTAVVVQAMVFGNHGPDSGAGAFFSRNPITGANEPFGEWLPGGQGDDVVSGSVDVEPITALRDEQPAVYDELMDAARSLERLGSDVQEIEFTVEDGSAVAAADTGRGAVGAGRGAAGAATSARRTHRRCRDAAAGDPGARRTLLLPALQPETRLAAPLLAKGSARLPGRGVGQGIHRCRRGAGRRRARASRSSWCATTPGPKTSHGMLAAQGIVTEVGGATSHAAVVSRELGRVAVVGCGLGVAASLAGKQITVDGYGRRSARGQSEPVRMVGKRHARTAGAGRHRATDQSRCAPTPPATTRGWMTPPRPRCARP